MDKVRLKALLATPYRWDAATYINFIMAIYNIIKPEMERLRSIEKNEKEKKEAEGIKNDTKRRKKIDELTNGMNELTTNYNKEMAKFVQALSGESSQVLGDDDWVNKIGSVWHILKYDETVKKGKNGKEEELTDRYKLDNLNENGAAMKRKSIVYLLKLIRDKIEHIRSYKNEVKRDLKEKAQFFYEDITTGQFQFNENTYIAFWISKFPKLMPFLWIKFYKFKGQLTSYYPEDTMEINGFQDILLDPTKFNEELKCALFRDMENGNIVKRLKTPDGSCSVEFRGCRNLTKVVDKNSFIKFVLNSKDGVSLSVSHSSTSENILDYAGTEAAAETIVVLFTENIADEQLWKTKENGACRIILFSGPDAVNDESIKLAVERFTTAKNIDESTVTESPVGGKELSVEKQDWLYNDGLVNIQGRETKILNIFSGCSIDEVMGYLSGPFLNKILKNEIPTLCSEYKYPEYNGVYIERTLTVSGMGRCICNDRYMYREYFYDVDHLRYCKYKRDLEEFKKRYKPMSSADFKFMIENSGCRFYLSETELVQEIILKKMKTVCIRADSGMGKSKLLISLGKSLKKGLVIYCPFRIFVDLIKNRVENRNVSKEDVKLVILEILKCNDNAERSLIGKWLDQEADEGTKIELQLDGLDEVTRDSSSLALDVCKVIECNFRSIRLWITCCKSFWSYRKSSETVYCRICPFSRDDIIKYFELSWRGGHESFTEEQLKEAVHKLFAYFHSFSDKLMPGEFMGYPLNCSMIAEIFEDKLTGLTEFKESVTKLYESIFHKRLVNMRIKKYNQKDETSGEFEYLKRGYRKLHTYFALKHLFPEVSNDFNEPEAIKFLKDFTQMGIITEVSPITFLHLKYAHFFVASYIIEVLETDNLDNMCSKEAIENLFYYGFPTQTNQIDELPFCWVLVDKYLEGLSDWDNLRWWKAKKTSQKTTTKKNEMSLFVASAIRSKLWNLASLLIDLWVDKTDESVCNQILELAVMGRSPINWFIKKCKQLHYNNHHKLLKFSVENFVYEIARYLMKNKCGNEAFGRIAEMRESEGGGGIFHCIVDKLVKVDKWVNPKKFLRRTKKFIKFVHEMNNEEINRKDKYGLNFFLAIPLMSNINSNFTSEHMFKLKEFLIEELGADINEITDKGESVLSLGKDFLYRNVFNDEDTVGYHKMLMLLKQKGNFAHINLKSKTNGFTPLLEAVNYFGDEMSTDTLQLFKNMQADFNATDEFGNTVLHICHQNCKNEKLAAKINECGGTFGDVMQGKLVERG